MAQDTTLNRQGTGSVPITASRFVLPNSEEDPCCRVPYYCYYVVIIRNIAVAITVVTISILAVNSQTALQHDMSTAQVLPRSRHGEL